MQTIQVLSIIGSVGFFFVIVELIRKKKLKEAYAIIWLSFSLVFLFFSIWRKALDHIAKILEINYPPATLFLLLIITIVAVLIQMSVVISKQTDEIKKLTQSLAILKEKIQCNSFTEEDPHSDK